MKFYVEVEDVRGHCTRGYKKGDHFVFNDYDTPDGFCGSSYTVLFPILMTFRSGGSFSWEKDPYCKTAVACPDGGTVLFKISPKKD